MAAPTAGAAQTGASKAADAWDALEPLRRRLHVSGAFLVIAGVCAIFLSWDYPGAALAIAAGSIACDSFSSAARTKGRLTGAVHCCGSSPARGRGGCCSSPDPLCGAPSHIAGMLVALFVISGIFEVASILYVWTRYQTYAWSCQGYSDAVYRSSCPFGGEMLAPGTNPPADGGTNDDGATATPAYQQYQQCSQWAYCASGRYDYVISAASIAVHLVFFIAGGIAFSSITALRAAVAGTYAAVIVGPAPCGPPGGGGGALLVGGPMPAAGGPAHYEQQPLTAAAVGEGPALVGGGPPPPPAGADGALPYPQQRMGGVAV